MEMNRWQRKLRVLVADDFAENCIMLACAMRQTTSLQVIHTVNRGREAVRYLLGSGRYTDRATFPLPDVIITEMGMGCLETLKLLAELGLDGFKLPLRIVVSASPEQEERSEAARLGADAYFAKPERFQGLVDIVQEIEDMALQTRRNRILRIKEHALKRALR